MYYDTLPNTRYDAGKNRKKAGDGGNGWIMPLLIVLLLVSGTTNVYFMQKLRSATEDAAVNEGEQHQAQAKLRQKNTEVETISRDLQRTKNALATSEKQVRDKEQLVIQSRQQQDSLRHQINERDSALEKATTDLLTAQAELKNFQASNEALQSQLYTAEQEKNKKHEEVTDMHNSAMEHYEMGEKLRARLAELEAKVQESSSSKEVHEMNKQMEAHIAHLEQRLEGSTNTGISEDVYKAVVEAKDREIALLKGRVETEQPAAQPAPPAMAGSLKNASPDGQLFPNTATVTSVPDAQEPPDTAGHVDDELHDGSAYLTPPPVDDGSGNTAPLEEERVEPDEEIIRYSQP